MSGDVFESAIDDDDWEDLPGENSRGSGVDDGLSFSRVESPQILTSQQSLITTMLRQNNLAAAPQNAASKSTPALKRPRTSSPQGPSGFKKTSVTMCWAILEASILSVAIDSIHFEPEATEVT
jgi:hypothetical protein